MKRPALSILTFLLLSLPAAAVTRSEFDKWVAQLTDNPGDADLRRKIIKTALDMDPMPGIPEEANESIARAGEIVKTATSQKNFRDAVAAYQKALAFAPWSSDLYFNLSLAQERSGDPAAAIECLEFYLVAAPDASDREAVHRRIDDLKKLGAKRKR